MNHMILGVLLDFSRLQVCLWRHGDHIICLIELCEDEDEPMDSVCIGQGLACAERHVTMLCMIGTINRPDPMNRYKIGVIPSFYRCLLEETGVQKRCRVSNTQTWN